jgi:hypothetical protein
MAGLGDAVERALKKVGITEEKVSKFLGRPCGCRARRDRLNSLSSWAMRTLGMNRTDEDSLKDLVEVVGDPTVVEELKPPQDQPSLPNQP